MGLIAPEQRTILLLLLEIYHAITLRHDRGLFFRQPRIFKTAVHVVRVMGLIVLDASRARLDPGPVQPWQVVALANNNVLHLLDQVDAFLAIQLNFLQLV